jgi:formylglycine-generating enzyme required for sulfatase activity
MRSAKFMRVIILDRVEFVEVAAGPFWMGWDEGLPGEGPRHRVVVDRFEIARAPVTRAEYAEYLRAAGAAPPPFWDDPRFADPRQPAVGVSWHDAVAFCRWLGPGYRLPTEAEWEKAARGGLDGARFPWGEDRPDGRLDRPPLAGSTPANPFGLTDLSGVCHEWCLDWDADDYYRRSPPANPRGPEFGTRRVSRGGAWRHADPWSPVAHRSSLPPHLRYSDYGFRVARDGPRLPPSVGGG